MDQTYKVNRREFMGAALGGAVAGLAGTRLGAQVLGAEAPRGQAAKRPNVLLIITDEHNAGVMGCNGNPIIQTKHIDSLAKQGVMFDNCYCNSPLSVPSRHSITSCRYISRVGVWSNNSWLPSDDIPSIARIMTAAGYDSLLIGKMHFDRTRRYGFDELWGTLNNNYVTGTGKRRPANAVHEPPGYTDRLKDIGPSEHSHVLDHDRQVTSHTLKFLKERKAEDKPFFLIAGYLAPHFPLIVPQAYLDKYKGRVPMPVNPPASVAAQPLNYQMLRVGFHDGHVPPAAIDLGRELYYGLTNWVDDQIGEVLQALAASDAAQDTIVIYTADHGENMGEHVLWWKNCMYQHSAHVPLIVRYPQRWAGGQHRPNVCSLVDMVQTVADMGGGNPASDWNGHSLLPVLDDPKASWKDMAVSEYYAHNIASGFAMLRSGNHKFVYHNAPDAHHPPQHELYDLSNDPAEQTNLAGNPAEQDRVAAMYAMLVNEIGEEPALTEKRCRADYARGYDRGPKEKKKRRKHKADADET